MAIDTLGPQLVEAEHAGLLSAWHFIRKGATWRLRCRPSGGNAQEMRGLLRVTLDGMVERGQLSQWVEKIYEPEVHAFGGPAAMDVAHDLFHQDSRHILGYLGRGNADGGAGQRRELSLLLCGVLMRSAGQDWYEQGDIWAQIRANGRAAPPPAPSEASLRAVRRLLTVDAGPGSALVSTGRLHQARDWLESFDRAGRALEALADCGLLTRGIRAVLAHHILFHWNRIGLPVEQQSLLATTASTIVFQREPPAPTAPLPMPPATPS